MRTVLICGMLTTTFALAAGRLWLRAQSPQPLDPKSWGNDHVGKPLPEYVTGDECLFCHRNDVGPSWGKNRHHRSLRVLEPETPEWLAAKKSKTLRDVAGEATLILGQNERARFLKPGGAYGQLDILEDSPPHWDAKKFGDGCAGCHATAVDYKTRAFSAISLDCYVCHGDINPDHAKDPVLVHLSKKRQDPPRVITSICAQCHVRSGRSRSTGLAYPHHFVAGDNLFRDFDVDFSPAAIGALNPADRHVLENVRDVVLFGKEELTCLSCHDIHRQSSKKHFRLAESDTCTTCHQAARPNKDLKAFGVHSKICGY